MRNTFLRSPSLTRADDPNLRFRFVSFEVKMWRRCERPRFTLPVAVFLKRLAAPLCVFSFGMSPQTQLSALRRQLSVSIASCWIRLASGLRRGFGDLRRWLARVGSTMCRSLLPFLFSFFLRLLRRQDRVQCVAFLPRTKLHNAVRFHVLNQPLQNLASQAGAGHFAATEKDGRLDLVALIQEAQYVILLGLVIVVVHVDAEFDLFYGDRFLMLLGFALFLFLLVEILPVVHDAAHGRLRGGRNLNQVQILFAGFLEGFVGRHDAKLLPVVINHADFARPNAIVGADKTFIDTVLRALSD